jgi:hypothetical protein
MLTGVTDDDELARAPSDLRPTAVAHDATELERELEAMSS